MIFHHAIFSPEFIPDPRLRAVLTDAVAGASDVVRSTDVLAATIRLGDIRVAAILSGSLRNGATLADVLQGITPVSAPSRPERPAQQTRDAFAPRLLKALDEFEAVLHEGGGLFDQVALELLLHAVLTNLAEEERHALAGLDSAAVLNQLRGPLARAAGGQAGGDPEPTPGEAVFFLPPQLAPSEDLTRRAREGAIAMPFPFDGEPRYEQLFDALARVLHRRQRHHALLVGERGVGKTTLVAELARRAAVGRIPFLARRRFLSVDCRYVPPDESRQQLAALLAHVASRPELVVCLDGLPALLRAERFAGNKAILLSGLARARCQFVGLLTPRDYEELFADDPDLAEFFDRVDTANTLYATTATQKANSAACG
jgi:ATP-dependent Clp protease ATP-binding subunit ClpA